MSEQVKRWAMWRAIEELGPDDWVVRDTCYDALAQRCRGLEEDLKACRTENVRISNWYSEAGIREDALRAEVERLMKIVGSQVIRRFVGNDQQSEIDELVALGIEQDKQEIADLKARLLEAERGTEDMVRLRAEKRELIERIQQIVTHAHESKEALAHRVRQVLEGSA